MARISRSMHLGTGKRPSLKNMMKSSASMVPTSPLADIEPASQNKPPAMAPPATPNPSFMPAPMVGGEPLPRMHEGGPVTEDGMYELKAGEKIHKATVPEGEVRRIESPAQYEARVGCKTKRFEVGSEE